ncbi:MAG: metal ABC transporter ATP-binding protein [bacterium]
MNNCIEIKNLSFAYHKELILNDITVSIPQNTIIGLIGPNGAGKTTLAKIIIGLFKPTKGSIQVLGSSPQEARGQIGYAPQYFSHERDFPITVGDVVLMGRLSAKKLLHRFTKEDHAATHAALTQVNMSSYKDHNIAVLSGGQKQRVLLARALVCNPKLLILDEPLTGIDICLEFEFYELLKILKQTRTIILISHDIGVISQHVDNIICLNKTIFCHDDKETALKNLDKIYGCPVDIVAHGVPHRILKDHKGPGK